MGHGSRAHLAVSARSSDVRQVIARSGRGLWRRRRILCGSSVPAGCGSGDQAAAMLWASAHRLRARDVHFGGCVGQAGVAG